MKKLLLTGLAIASLIAVNIQAQPIAQDAQFYSRGVGYSGNLRALANGGTPPYTFAFLQANNQELEVYVNTNGEFTATVPLGYTGETRFQYTATDANGAVSNPATIAIKFGQEKG